MLLAGAPIIYFPYVHITLKGIAVALSTTAGAASLIIGILLMTLGITLWFHQQVRVFAGIAGLLLSLVSFPLANFGASFSECSSALSADPWLAPGTRPRRRPRCSTQQARHL